MDQRQRQELPRLQQAQDAGSAPQIQNKSEQHNDVSSRMADTLRPLEREFKKQLENLGEAARCERQKLCDEIDLWKQKAARVDDLRAENDRFRQELEQCRRRDGDSIAAAAPEKSETSGQLVHDAKTTSGANKGNSIKSKTVPYSEFEKLSTKCEQHRKDADTQRKHLKFAKTQGGHYKIAYERYRTAYDKLKVAREKDKAAVRSWQDFWERQRAEARAARSAHSLLGEYLRVAENPPPSISPSDLDSIPASSRPTPSNESPLQAVTDTSGPQSSREQDGGGNHQQSLSKKTPESPLANAIDVAIPRTDQAGSVSLPSERRSTLPAQAVVGDVQERCDGEKPSSVSSSTSNFDQKASVPSTVSKVVRSSQTTEDEDEIVNEKHDGLEITLPDSGSDPVIVSSRVIKRKRTAEWDLLQTNDQSIVIKDEPSSSPMSYPGLAQLVNNESMDLNDFPRDVSTPRKRRHYAWMMPRLDRQIFPQELDSNSAHGRSTSFPPQLEKDISKTESSVPGPDLQVSGPNLRSVKSESPNQSTNVGETRQLDQAKLRKPASGANSPRRDTMVLQPMSVNTRILPRTSEKKSICRRRGGLAGPISELSEDGETFLTGDQAPGIVGSMPKTAENDESWRKSRLHSLLETPLSERQPLNRQVMEQRTGSAERQRSRPQGGNDHLRRALGTPTQPFKPAEKPLTPDSAEEPVRARPVNRLGLEDFKVNPKANQGYDYAFNEVVRNRDQRRCLPGCTRPECCGGHFRKMVELGGAPTPRRGLWDESQTDDDQRLLEEYLGGDTQRLNAMSDAERQETLLSARAALLAQNYGRHRQAFQRPKTPPGFWRSDFPSTQELDADRLESTKREREMVEERRREATRPNGLWMFRDE